MPKGIPGSKPTCSIDGCEGSVRGGGWGWCVMHYQRWRRNGDPVKLVRGVPNLCTIPGCTKIVNAHSLCAMHHRRKERHGDALDPGRDRTPKTCAARCQGYCSTHYTRWQRHGDPLANLRTGLEGTADSRRRALIRASMGAPFRDVDIFERDGWVCQLCHEPVDPAVSRKAPLGATIDHVTPLTRGGSHCAGNVQLAHRVCNNRKGTRLTG